MLSDTGCADFSAVYEQVMTTVIYVHCFRNSGLRSPQLILLGVGCLSFMSITTMHGYGIMTSGATRVGYIFLGIMDTQSTPFNALLSSCYACFFNVLMLSLSIYIGCILHATAMHMYLQAPTISFEGASSQ